MTETARMADIVLPATMFTEHDDLYQGGGNQYVILGPKLVEPPGECRTNHEVICALAERLGAEHQGFHMSPREHIDWMLRATGRGTVEELEEKRFLDIQPDFETAHYLKGFAWPDGKFRLKPDWAKVPFSAPGRFGPHAAMPEWPDHWAVIEEATEEYPFRLVTSPARSFLNSSFTETPGSITREKRPELMIHPDDAAALDVEEGELVRVASPRGEVLLHARLFDGLRRGVVVAESIWPNKAHRGGRGINSLTGADPVAPSAAPRCTTIGCGSGRREGQERHPGRPQADPGSRAELESDPGSPAAPPAGMTTILPRLKSRRLRAK